MCVCAHAFVCVSICVCMCPRARACGLNLHLQELHWLGSNTSTVHDNLDMIGGALIPSV